jgi:phage FluMu gp28-like protein
VCLDYTGPGVGMGDYLVKEFGEWNPEKHQGGKIELVTFTNTNKVEMFTKLRMSFERAKCRVPINRVIREDLHSMQRVVSAQGNITYRAPHTDDGHADRCTAKALAERARGGGGTTGKFSIPSGKRARVTADRRNREVNA